MKKLFRATIIVFFSIVILFAALAITAWSLEDRVTDLAVKQISQQLDAPIGMEKATFSLIREFPLATVQFDGLWLGISLNDNDSTPGQIAIDTLANFDRLYVSVMTLPLLDNIFKVTKVEIAGGHLKYVMDSTGASGFDHFIPTDTATSVEQDTASSQLNFTLDKLTIHDLAVHFKDDQHKIKAETYIEELIGNAVIDSTQTLAVINGDLRLTDCSFDSTNLYKMKQTNISFDLTYLTDSLAIRQFKINSDGVALETSGNMLLSDLNAIGIDFDVSIDKIDLAEVKKYVPEQYFDDLEVGDLEGLFKLNSKVNGVYSDSLGLMPYYEGTFELSEANFSVADYPKIENILLKGFASNGGNRNNETTLVKIDTFNVHSDMYEFLFKGSIKNLDRIEYDIDATIGTELTLLRPFMPDSVVQDISGKIGFDVQSRGVLPDSITDSFTDYMLQTSRLNGKIDNVNVVVDTSLSLQKLSCEIAYKDHEFTIDSFDVSIPQYNINIEDNSIHAKLNGQIMNLDSSKIDLSINKLGLEGAILTAKAKIENLNHPIFAFNGTADIDLAKIEQFIPDSVVNSVQGKIETVVKSEGTLNISSDSITDQVMDILYENTVINSVISDFQLDMPDSLLDIEKLNAQVEFNPKELIINDLDGKYMGIDFSSKTTKINNLVNTVIKDKPGKLEVEGEWKLGKLDYDRLMSLIPTEDTTNQEVEDTVPIVTNESSWDMNYEIKGKAFVESLQYGDALLEDISTLLKVTPTQYIIDKLAFKAFGGDMLTSLNIRMGEEERMEIDLKTQVNDAEIRRLLSEMENLYQEEIYPKNMDGTLSTDEFFMRIVMIGDSLDFPAMRATGDVKFENGGIYNYEMVSSMAPLIPGIKSLDTLDFKTIDTHFFIFKNSMYIPRTHVVSNVLDASMLGTQSFDLDFDYHLQITIGDVILGKSKKRKKEEAAMGEEVDEEKRRSIFLRSFSQGDKFKNTIDNKKDRQMMGLKVKSREKMLNLIFHPKLVSFETGVE